MLELGCRLSDPSCGRYSIGKLCLCLVLYPVGILALWLFASLSIFNALEDLLVKRPVDWVMEGRLLFF